MPLFEYVCDDCYCEFEMLVGPSEKPRCPKCESTKLEKLMSAASGRVASGSALPMASACPPPEAGPCSPHCCRLPG
ncbi:FmdB family zinc ribbon protein [Fuerstiella marisgermanici]|uniref:FmdB family zinc ribbon protein n=1 Tax=Fuerstiella marisgermanici TaxID=1891926 RepID=UPI00097C77DF|nr:FmdB family zinc ribbon protein [Fuerstiella marisgermanici]